MYQYLLPLHSLFRWLVLASLIIAIYRGYSGWLAARSFSRRDDRIRHYTATIAHIQLIIGLWLYYISPVISHFLNHYQEAVHQRDVRFFGMEHSIMMVLAVVIITLGSMKAKRRSSDTAKFKAMAVWYSLALIIILISIPWSFSPMAARPLFRFF